MASEQERIQAEIAELKAYDLAIRSTSANIRELKSEQVKLENKGKRYTSEYQDVSLQRAEQRQHLDQQWRDIQANYPDIATGRSGNDRLVTSFEVSRDSDNVGRVGEGLDSDAAYKVTLVQAILLREDTLRTLEQQQMLTPLKDTIDTVHFKRTPPTPHEPASLPQATLTPAERAVLEQKRSEFSDKNITPLKDTRDAIDPDRKSSTSGTPPPPPSFLQSLKDMVNRPEPSAPAAPPPSFGERFEQPAAGERKTVEEYGKQKQAEHEQQFQQRREQQYEKQSPQTPAPQQPGHLQQQEQSDAHAGWEALKQEAVHLTSIGQGIEQMKADMAKEQGHPSAPSPTPSPQYRPGSLRERILHDAQADHPHEGPEQDRSR